MPLAFCGPSMMDATCGAKQGAEGGGENASPHLMPLMVRRVRSLKVIRLIGQVGGLMLMLSDAILGVCLVAAAVALDRSDPVVTGVTGEVHRVLGLRCQGEAACCSGGAFWSQGEGAFCPWRTGGGGDATGDFRNTNGSRSLI